MQKHPESVEAGLSAACCLCYAPHPRTPRPTPRASALPSLRWGRVSPLPFVRGLNDPHLARLHCKQLHHCGSKTRMHLWSRLDSQLAICKGQTQQDSCSDSKSDFNGRQVALGSPVLFAEVTYCLPFSALQALLSRF